jgi:hypothetical protein
MSRFVIWYSLSLAFLGGCAMRSLPAASPAAVLVGDAVVPFERDSVAVHLRIDQNGGTMQITMRGPEDRWFGWGFGASEGNHQGYAIVNLGPENLAREYSTTGFTTPVLQIAQDCTGATVTHESGGFMTVSFDRLQDDGDFDDYQFPVTAGRAIDVVWGVGKSLTFLTRSATESRRSSLTPPGTSSGGAADLVPAAWGTVRITFRDETHGS